MATVKWNGELYAKLIEAGLRRNMHRATARLEREVKRKLRIGQPIATLPGGWKTGFQPSRPMQPPRTFSGQLRKTIFRRVMTEEATGGLLGQVGSNLPYARSLELGRRGGRIIRPRRAKALLIPIRRQFEAKAQLPLFGGKKSRRRIKPQFIFRKQVRLGDMAPRPFLVPTLRENVKAIGRLLRARIPLPNPKGPA